MKPDISVITVNYNGLELTAAMIASLRQYVSTPIETIVVDNGSLRDEAHLLVRLDSGEERAFSAGEVQIHKGFANPKAE